MKLKDEIKLNDDFQSINHESILSVVLTASLLFKISDRLFSEDGITGTQFNILMTLNASNNEGLSQQELSERLVVTKSNVVGLVDRMEEKGLIERRSDPDDRRTNKLYLTKEGQKLILNIEPIYFRKIDQLMEDLSDSQKKTIIKALEIVRENVRRDKEAA